MNIEIREHIYTVYIRNQATYYIENFKKIATTYYIGNFKKIVTVYKIILENSHSFKKI